ncbi:MAG: TetM/TetW/TetO/TetS family tetracycline resistance ribosomal protection protein [Clostridium sp.]|nr:TetM/TetW/TetO/TetS family tetracycline resistance ribosomal protection protein [Clostridium sp.]
MEDYRVPITIGIFAHVDAGKTTLAEALLYLCKTIRTPGRVDHRNTYLDTQEMERSRGITIFSKQAVFMLDRIDASGSRIQTPVTLLDTPGHADFIAEAERVFPVLDYAILVISAADGVQSHTLTLWRTLRAYQIPTFLFLNKMDQPGSNVETLFEHITHSLEGNFVRFDRTSSTRADTVVAAPTVPFSPVAHMTPYNESFYESIAMCNEHTMNLYLDKGTIDESNIRDLIKTCQVYPCYSGSALKITGVTELLQGLSTYLNARQYPSDFGAYIYKITRDEQGIRLTHLKITGGIIKVKDQIVEAEEKVNQIRIYSGEKYTTPTQVSAGTVCAVTGPMSTIAGELLGEQRIHKDTIVGTEPILEYRMILPLDWDSHDAFRKCKQLEEELPNLQLQWIEATGEIRIRLMGEVEMEIISHLIKTRFGQEVTFGPGSIIYKETIADTVEGVGHYEPLRHYAEVHLLMEPGVPGSGIIWNNRADVDQLSPSQQQHILSGLKQRQHIGVLTGSQLTDVVITLMSGKFHPKHTQGGDFAQASSRAVRQGLRHAQNVLLEPFYAFSLSIPTHLVGHAFTDLQNMSAKVDPLPAPGAADEDHIVISGTAPVWNLQDYALTLGAYSHGLGKLSLQPSGYYPCARAEEVIAAIAYDPEHDLQNPSGSIFCAHGAGFYVEHDQVEAHMHLPSCLPNTSPPAQPTTLRPTQPRRSSVASDAELKAIFERTYGTTDKKKPQYEKKILRPKPPTTPRISSAERAPQEKSLPVSSHPSQDKPTHETVRERYLLVDGYNIIFAWQEFKELAAITLDGARNRLMDLLCNYQGYTQDHVILVFDAYKVPQNQGTTNPYHNIHIVYTKEAETADQYIEKTVHKIAKHHHVTVATSDALEQMIIWGDGAYRLSARGLWEELMQTEQEIRAHFPHSTPSDKFYLFENLIQRKLDNE